MKARTIFFSGLIILIIHSCKSNKSDLNFNIDGTSTIKLNNESNDTVKIKIENWYQFPWKSQIIDTLITNTEILDLEIITQGYNYYKVNIGDENLKIFANPNSSTTITISENNQIQFSGTLESINKFIHKKSKDFNSVDAEWLARTNLTHGTGTTTDLFEGNDSITQIHIDYLNTNKEGLPNWFVEFEKKRLKFLTFDWKIRSIWYRKNLLFNKDSLPITFLNKSLENLDIEDNSFFGNENYMRFLSSYLLIKSDLFYSTTQPKTKEDFKKRYRKNFKTIEQEFKGKLKDVFLTYELGNIIESNRYIFEENWVNKIEDKNLNEYLLKLYRLNPILPKGSKLPYFSLLDSNNIRYESRQFNGQILLINFWATWCKPCIKEFSHENQLVDQFKNEPVKIVNICIESDSVNWKSIIEKFKLNSLNLISKNNWDEKLTKDFGIQGLPHSTLIDRNGLVVQNKCPLPSEGVDELINKLLIGKKKIETTN